MGVVSQNAVIPLDPACLTMFIPSELPARLANAGARYPKLLITADVVIITFQAGSKSPVTTAPTLPQLNCS